MKKDTITDLIDEFIRVIVDHKAVPAESVSALEAVKFIVLAKASGLTPSELPPGFEDGESWKKNIDSGDGQGKN